MAEYQTLLEKHLLKVMEALGASVATHPWPFLLLPLALSGALGSGFIYLSTFNAYDMEDMSSTIRNPASDHRRFIQAHFPSNDAKNFSAQRLSTLGTFAALMAVATGDTLLTQVAFTELLSLDQAVRDLRTPKWTFAHLCAHSYGTCSSPNPVLSALQGDPARIEALLPNLTWPLAFQGRVFLAPFLGGVKLGPGGAKGEHPVVAAKALQLLYYLQEDEPSQRQASQLWLKTFLERIPNVLGSLNLRSIQVAHFTSLSKQENLKKRSKELIPFLSSMYFLTIFLSVISCARLDCVRTRVWVAVFGVFSSVLSMLSAFGLMLFCRVPFFFTIAVVPFLVLGVSIDSTFILISCWERTKVKDSVKDRMADTYAKAAASVTFLNIGYYLCTFFSLIFSHQSTRSFCLYTGTSFVFCYLYSVTFLGAILALNGRREESNRHWLTFMKVETEPQDSRGRAYNVCCVGGAFDESTGTETEHAMSGFFRKHYGPFLMRTQTKVLVVILYLLYLGSCIYGIIHGMVTLHEQGTDIQSVIYNSDAIQYFYWGEKYFSAYGPKVMVVVTKSIAYWDPSVRVDLEKCMGSLESSLYVDKELSESWLRMYGSVALQMSLNMDDKNVFIGNLNVLFNVAPDSQWDINFTSTGISTSRFYIQLTNISVVHNSVLLRELRGLAKTCKFPVIVYHPLFIVLSDIGGKDFITGIFSMVILVWFLLTVNLFLVCWFWFISFSIVLGVFGYMYFWRVNPQPLPQLIGIVFIIVVEFSVNFCSHVAYGFISSEEAEVNDKVVDGLHRFGYSVVQESVSFILGLAVVFTATSNVFRTFFKIAFLAILLAAVHGLIFTPVFLTFCRRIFRPRNINVPEVQENPS